MWTKGQIKISKSTFTYWVKQFEEPSEEYGIKGGRVSKLMIKRGDEITYNYDRGLDIAPTDKETESVLEEILAKFN